MFRSRLSPCLCSELTGQMPQGKQSCSFTCSITKTRKPKIFHPASSSSKLCNPLTFSSVKQTLGYITTSPHTAALFFQETQKSHLVFSWSHSQLLHFLCWGKIRQESFLKHCYSRSDGLSPAGLSSTLQLEKMKLVLNSRIFPRDLIGGFVSLPCNSGTAARTKPMGINCKKALKATEASHCLPDLKPQDSLLPEEATYNNI